MKILSIIISCLSFMLLLVLGCSKAPLPTEPQDNLNSNSEINAKLIVTAIEEHGKEVDSAEVHLNGKLIGLTPLKYEEPEQGVSTIRVQKQPYMIFRESIAIPTGETVHVEAILNKIPANTGQLLVTVDQDSCQIQVNGTDGNLIDQTIGREFTIILEAGGYFIEVSKNGYESIIRATKVQEDSITIENLHLIPVDQILAPQIQVQAPDSAEVNCPILLQWEASNATRVDIDYIENPGLSGKREITFTTPGIRIISATAYNQSLSVTVSDTLVIYEKTAPSKAPPALEFEVTPEVVNLGEPAKLRWRTDGKYVMIDQGVGMRGADGSEEVTFTTSGTKIFTAIAYGAGGLTTTVKDSVYINPANDPLLPTITIEVSDSMEVGQPVPIEWHAWNATVVDVDYLGQVGLNGKAEISFDSPGMRIITATAYNLIGQTTDQDTTIIYTIEEPASPPTVDPIQVACDAVVGAHHHSLPQVIEEAAQVTIDVAGYYRVVAEVDYNSGDEQKNESFFIRIKNSEGSLQSPTDANAGSVKIVTDDPGPAHTSQRDAGTFYFSQGSHHFQVHHYATIAEQYPQFAINPPITGAESVRVVSFRLEYVAVQ